jgi:predicted cupin superfamily sugar epimerase
MNSEQVARIIQLLGLQGGSTCGFTGATFTSPIRIPASALSGFDGERDAGFCQYFLVTREAQVQLHRIRATQIYHHYAGAPLEVLLVSQSGTARTARVDGTIAEAVRPQLLIEGGTFHAARVAEGDWALLGTTLWPAVEPSDVEHADSATLCSRFPAAADAINRFFAAPAH